MKKYDWLILLFFIAAYLIPLGGRPMVTPDEFRYAQIPHEMLATGNYAAPRQLEMRYFEKPAPGYWWTAASFRVFGENAFALRLPCALGALLAAAMISFQVRQSLRDEKIAAAAAILFLCCGLVYGIGTFAVLDSQTTGFITGVSVTAFLAAVEPHFNRRKTALLIACGIFAALAFMTNGFIAFAVPGLSMLGFLIWERRWKEFYQLPWIPLVTAVVVIAPWALAAHRADGDFWRYFTIVEHWERFTMDNPGQHPEPWWFLILPLVGGAFPAALLAPTAFAIGYRRWKELLRLPLYRFSLCAVVLPFLFFSASSGKLATYVLPCFPPLAVLGAGGIAAYFRSGGSGRTFRWTMDIWSWLMLIGGVGAILTGILAPVPELVPLRPMLFVAGGIGIVYGAALWYCRRYSWRPRFYGFFAGLGILLLAGGWLIPDELLGAKAPERALRELAAELNYDPSQVMLVTHPSLMQALAWTYGRSDVRLLGSTGELEYGIERAEKNGEYSTRLTRQEFNALLNDPQREIGIVYIARDRKNEGFDFLGPAAEGAQEGYINEVRAVYLPAPVAAATEEGKESK